MNDIPEIQSNQLSFKTYKNFFTKLTLGVIFFTLSFIISNNLIFKNYPLFGIRFVGETLLSFAIGLLGFHTIPILLSNLKDWLEAFLKSIVSNIVWDFWDQQSKRMQTARRKKQKENAKLSKKKLTEKYDGSILLDTSVLIDGRVVQLAKSGFFPSTNALILNDVLNELHLLSDSADDLKRQKGRRGLDVTENLKKVLKVKIVKYHNHGNEEHLDVDKKLLSFAKNLNLRLMTLDFNLNKLASIQNVKILNLNDLVEAIKPEFIPGEKINVKIVQKGKEKNQGVAYLRDGTMIVIENGGSKIGENVEVEVSRLIQSPAGKMVFSKINSEI